MVQRARQDAVELLETTGGVLRVGKDVAAFAEHAPIEIEQLAAEAHVSFRVFEIAVRRTAQFVRHAVLMDHPRNLARVAGEVAGKPGRNQQVDRLFVAYRQFEQPPRGSLRENLGFCLRPERNRDPFDCVVAPLQLSDERPDVQLRAAIDEGHLCVGDDDSLDVAVRWQIGS